MGRGRKKGPGKKKSPSPGPSPSPPSPPGPPEAGAAGPASVAEVTAMMQKMLIQSGQQQALRNYVRNMGVRKGWSGRMNEEFMGYIRRKGPRNVNVSHMVNDLAGRGRELMPADMKREMQETFFESVKGMFNVDESVPPLPDTRTAEDGPEHTFKFQDTDIVPDPGLGVGVESPGSSPPNPELEMIPDRSPESPDRSPAAPMEEESESDEREFVREGSPVPGTSASMYVPVRLASQPPPLTPQSEILENSSDGSTSAEKAEESPGPTSSPEKDEDAGDQDEFSEGGGEDDPDELLDV